MITYPFSAYKIYSYVINPLSTKLYLSELKTQSVSRSKHSASVLKTDKFMLYGEIIAVCSQVHKKQINCGRNTEFLNVKAGCT